MRLETLKSFGGLPRGLIESGKSGYHALFSNHAIRRTFKKIDQGLLREERLLAAHKALRSLYQYNDPDEMRASLKELEEDTHDLIVYLYFRAIERVISEEEDACLH